MLHFSKAHSRLFCWFTIAYWLEKNRQNIFTYVVTAKLKFPMKSIENVLNIGVKIKNEKFLLNYQICVWNSNFEYHWNTILLRKKIIGNAGGTAVVSFHLSNLNWTSRRMSNKRNSATVQCIAYYSPYQIVFPKDVIVAEWSLSSSDLTWS